MTHRQRDLRPSAGMTLVTLVAGHSVVFLSAFGAPGYAMAMQRTGHGTQWAVTVVVAAAIGTLLAGIAGLRLWALSRQARSVVAQQTMRAATIGFVVASLRLWLWLFLASTLLFAAVENLERAVAGQTLPGLAILIGSISVSPVVVMALISGLVAGVAALYRWRRDDLISRIERGRQAWARATSSRRRPATDAPIRWAGLARQLAVRAPPCGLRSSVITP
jgi:hypothetical protein